MFSPHPLYTVNPNPRIYTDIGTIVRVNAGAGYVHCTSINAPRQSKRLSWILNDPAAAGQVVCGVVVVVATETWRADRPTDYKSRLTVKHKKKVDACLQIKRLTGDHAAVVCRWGYVQLGFRRHLDLDFQAKGCVDLDIHGGLPENQSMIW